MRTPQEVLTFWFTDHDHHDWFGAKSEFDAELAERFAATHARVALGEAFSWRTTPKGRLAEILVLDQFSRQLFRNSPRAFASDAMALALAQEAVAAGLSVQFDVAERVFLYLPYQHSESRLIQEESVRLHAELGGDMLDYALAHRDVIARFGRFPKRNFALGRRSTADEVAHIAAIEGIF